MKKLRIKGKCNLYFSLNININVIARELQNEKIYKKTLVVCKVGLWTIILRDK